MSAYIIAAIGGFMMGLAILWLSGLLKSRLRESDDPKSNGDPWKIIVGFAVGVPLGALAVTGFGEGALSTIVPLFLVGLVAGLFAFWIVSRIARA